MIIITMIIITILMMIIIINIDDKNKANNYEKDTRKLMKKMKNISINRNSGCCRSKVDNIF